MTERSGGTGSSPDVPTLVVGVFALVVAAAVAFGWASDLQWVLAAAAVAVGVLMLVSSTRGRSKR
ncbi:hypothetical protein [Saccharopolyspora montiporae]|uniref:hypothetical protein n=1 Tax=Saccharopolyspora montiporae TaxID=2781240 RepID=UPI001D13A187|nr:hypothetical protein [Saccharopolyspora sp. HNM0983]